MGTFCVSVAMNTDGAMRSMNGDRCDTPSIDRHPGLVVVLGQLSAFPSPSPFLFLTTRLSRIHDIPIPAFLSLFLPTFSRKCFNSPSGLECGEG